MERYNLIVLGAGSGGLTVAGGGAIVSARVALINTVTKIADAMQLKPDFNPRSER